MSPETEAGSIWDAWIDAFVVPRGVQLFLSNDAGRVQTRVRGSRGLSVLCRSPEMEALVRERMEVLRGDHRAGSTQYDGLIYMMYRESDAGLIPLYIGKANTIGVKGGLSANLNEVTSTARFARWGDGYAYHVGDLSAVVLGHPTGGGPKYGRWSRALFVPETTQLLSPVYFWCMAWPAGGLGLYGAMPVTLRHLENQLIGLAAQLFPDDLLNRDGA